MPGRAEPRQPRRQGRERRLPGLRPAVERRELEVGAEQLEDDRPRLVVQRLDVDAAGRGADAHLPPCDRAVQRPVHEAVREVGAERAEAARREREVERLR